MIPHDKISSYIDNELGHEQEQEFLISLAASEGLRQAFRSELILQNVIHQDEMRLTPPRQMRGALFATIGLGLAGAAAADATPAHATTQAAQHAATQVATHGSSSLVKTMFATKVNTLITALSLSVGAVVGYSSHNLISPSSNDAQKVEVTHQQPSVTAPMQNAPVQNAPVQVAPTEVTPEVKPEVSTPKSVASSGVKSSASAKKSITTTPSTVGSSEPTGDPVGVNTWPSSVKKPQIQKPSDTSK
jgi:hypothetical protein